MMTTTHAIQLYPSEKHAQLASQTKNTEKRMSTSIEKNSNPNK
jgi:hypothetical protein